MPVLLSLLRANSAWNGCLISFEWLFLSAQTICHYHVVKRALHKTKARRKKKTVGAKYQFDSPPAPPPQNIYFKTNLLRGTTLVHFTQMMVWALIFFFL